MAVKLRSVALSSLSGFRRGISILFWVPIVGSLVLFGLQWPHSADLDGYRVVQQLHHFGDPLIARMGSWIGQPWPATQLTRSYLPLGIAFAFWVVKISINAALLQTHRALVKKLTPARKGAAVDVGGYMMAADTPTAATSEEARQQLLKRYREIEQVLKQASRKRCTFLSIDVVGSTSMKKGQEETDVTVTFRAYEDMLKEIFREYGAWKQAWTPDGVMVCFLQVELAVSAAEKILQDLEGFNETSNRLPVPIRVRCGLNEGEVPIFEDTRLEKVAHQVIDVAGHMQKEASPDTLWVGHEVYQMLPDKAGFIETPHEVDGFKVYEWCEGPHPQRAPVRFPAAATTSAKLAAGAAAASPIEATMISAHAAGGMTRIGRYEILEELGRGAMGAVYKARDPQIGRTVAIKMILTSGLPPSELQEYKQRFYREAQTAGQMSHPGIVTIHDISEHETGQPYLVMEFVEGTTLDKLLSPKSPGRAPERLSLDQSLDIVIQVAQALDYAHRRGVVHRDIKPANVLLTGEGKVKLADFGIAKLAGSQLTQVGQVMGTPAFMSPEQFTGAAVDARSDIFSLGTVLYWMCTGEKPFSGDSITTVIYKTLHTSPIKVQELNPSLPPALDKVLSRCLAKNPAERYSTAEALAVDLQAVRSGGSAAPPAAEQ